MKQMELIGQYHPDKLKIDLSIEKDIGNSVLILMGGKEEEIKANWQQLHDLCTSALDRVHYHKHVIIMEEKK